ncbi:MAG: YciI family protein [Methanomassiliicoccaceae archaeon]|nr:YciI family protein [Methanomassiliicoccaceae archaeon]
MEKLVYVMMIERGRTYNRINKVMVVKHVDRIRKLDDDGRLVLAGAAKGYPGVAGMIVFRAESQEEAESICELEPFVIEGYATYRLFSLRVGDRDNNYLLD